MIRDPAIRYKSGKIDDLKNDNWFSDISFTDLYNKSIDLEDKLNVDYNYVFVGKDNSNKNTAINEETYVGKTTRSLIDEFNNNFTYFND